MRSDDGIIVAVVVVVAVAVAAAVAAAVVVVIGPDSLFLTQLSLALVMWMLQRAHVVGFGVSG